VVKVKPRGGRRSAADSPSLEGFNGSEHAPSSKDRRGPRFLSHLSTSTRGRRNLPRRTVQRSFLNPTEALLKQFFIKK
jgi:hypothetical protein